MSTLLISPFGALVEGPSSFFCYYSDKRGESEKRSRDEVAWM